MASNVPPKKQGSGRKPKSTQTNNNEMEKRLVDVVQVKIPTPMPQNSPSFERQKNNEIPNRLMELQVKTKANKGKKKIVRESYKFYIFKVLKQVHADVGISSKEILIMDNLINDMFDRLSSEACKLARYARKNMVTSREVKAAAGFMIPSEL